MLLCTLLAALTVEGANLDVAKRNARAIGDETQMPTGRLAEHRLLSKLATGDLSLPLLVPLHVPRSTKAVDEVHALLRSDL